MFTSINAVLKQLNAEGWNDITLEYINKGVMTDTYKMHTKTKKYAVRCYPNPRRWLAEVEYSYLIDFAKNGIKAPLPVCTNKTESKITYLIYEWVEGETLNDKFTTLNENELNDICIEVICNYQKINKIKVNKYGGVNKGSIYGYNSWSHFIKAEIEKSRKYFKQTKNIKFIKICNGLFDYVDKIKEPSPCLVWSDFSFDNIIISKDNHLAAFIDFEGMMSGDPLLGIGYILSHSNPTHPFTRLILEQYNIDRDDEVKKTLDFYAVFRYIRLSPYVTSNTPNNTIREPLDVFLPYVNTIDNQFIKECNLVKRIMQITKFMWKKIIILSLTIIACFIALHYTSINYSDVLSKSNVEIPIQNLTKNLRIKEEPPVWFAISDTSISTYKAIDNSEKELLYNCMEPIDSIKNDSHKQEYIKKVNELIYKSNNNYSNTKQLFVLTLCIVFLGCCARTFYDYIGWECYKGGQNMDTWWPWYVFRPIIGVPITAFLIVAFLTSMFSSLFSSKDLNTYLIVSFLAGFAMMEFVTMLRRSSKALFGSSN